MNPRRSAFFAIFVVLLLTLSGSFGISLFSAADFSSSSTAASPLSNTSYNSSFVRIPISLPSQMPRLGVQGTVPPTTPISLNVVISSRNPVGLKQYVNEVSSPLSPEYGHFINPQRYAELYGPDLIEVNSLSSYFLSKGLQTSIDQSNPNILHVSGNAVNVESALQVSLDSFRVSNRSYYSPLTMPQMPSKFSFVQTIYGLSNYESNSSFASPMYRTAGKISGLPAQSDSNNIYYTPSEMYQIYNSSSLLAAGYKGSGVTIAIIDAYGDPYIQQEVNNFSAQFNLPPLTVNQICVDGPCNYAAGVTQGWQPEIALDVEWAHAMAPGAAINLYIGSNSSFPLFDAVEQAVSNSSNSIISMSWGSPENSIAVSSPVGPVEGESYPWLDQVLQQAAAEGITAFTSSGDYGAYDQGYMGESLPYGGASYPSTDPYVTSVGGTSVYMNTTSGTIQFPYANATGGYGSETAWSWSDQNSWGTGGGFSTLFASPPWQHGPGFDTSPGTRGAPDVAWDADPATGVAIAMYDPGFLGVAYFVEGGTSVGSPSWAGALATIEQKAGHKLGLITPELYSILNNPAEYGKAFHDITTGNNNPAYAGVGWNQLTGVGSPNLGELSNYLAPTGSLDVSVKDSLTGQFASSFAYGSQIAFTANVTSLGAVVSSGTVVANITASNGQNIATDVPFSFNPGIGEWLGSYSIKSTDPPGEWVAKVLASEGSLSGWGVNTLTVGDGITVFLPIFNTTTLLGAVPKFTVGQTINITAEVTFPSGSCCITSGNFKATFNENSPSGKNEGSVLLSYNTTRGLWIGHYKIPPTADQDSWAMTVSGTDPNGNSGSTYNWLYVGLNVILRTDSPTYTLGESISINVLPEYTTGLEASTGSFTATILDGPQVIASLPLALNPAKGYWTVQMPLKTSSQTGFYVISVSGTDGRGSSGTSETVIRVAPYNLNGSIAIPKATISVNGGSEPIVSAKITYPNGSLMTQGSVDAFVYLDHEGFHFPIGLARMNYNPASESFVAPYLMGPSSPLNTSIGRYFVNVVAFDPQGNYGNLTSSFFVQGETHSPILISSNSEFNAANGVLQGAGSSTDPFIFAGWNTTSISISGNATNVYDFINVWVAGSSGDGIYLNTPLATGSLLEDVFAVSNQGNGIDVSGVPGITILSDVASGNGKSGVLVGNVTGSLPPDIALTVSNGNGENGFTVQNSRLASVLRDSASSNAKYGYYLYNLYNASIEFNNASKNPVGTYITGTRGQSLGQNNFLFSFASENGVGLEVNGFNQTLTGVNSSTSFVLAEFNLIENNSVGVLAGNNSIVQLLGNTIGFNGAGVIYKNSVAVITANVITQNNETALDILGEFSGRGGCVAEFANFTVLLYSSCISDNFISLNGNSHSVPADGIAISNLNGSLIDGNLGSHNTANGLDLSNVTGSAISRNNFNNNSGAGIYSTTSSRNRIDLNNMSSDSTGIFLNFGGINQVDRNNLTLDSLEGISLNFSTNSTITKNLISSVGSGCSGVSACKFAGGIQLENSSNRNTVTSNSISDVTASGKLGAGIILSGNSDLNLVYQNNATNNDAGIVISNSPSNTISSNDLASNKYGVYQVGYSNLDLASNTLTGDQQNIYPNSPIVSFTGIHNGTSISGVLKINWNSTGQAISNQSISIDGTPQAVSGSSFNWNSSNTSDGIHIITIKVTNAAGQNSSATLIISTTNHESLTVETIGPLDIPISNSMITLKNSTYSTNGITDGNGRVQFHGLTSGNYNASTTVNGSQIVSPVSYAANSTVVIAVPTLITTAQATRSSGGSVPIQVSGNLTASQLANAMLQSSSGGSYTLTFDLSGPSHSRELATIAIPKSSTASALVPTLSINGNKSADQSYSQDSSFYYVRVVANFTNSSQKISIQLNPASASFDIRYVIIIIVVVAIIAAGLVLAMRRPKRNFYLPSQPN
jgi:parallel beta-helix repeat protein